MAASRQTDVVSDHRTGQIGARPSPGPKPADASHGLQTLGQGERSTLLYVPEAYRSGHPMPLMVMLHGAGGNAAHTLPAFIPQADGEGVILLAPTSKGSTWDVILDDYGPDAASLDRALGDVFDRYAIDAGRVAVAGFSDGASYALSLGITNGTLFTHIVAFSPGFMAPTRWEGRPRIFISHGVEDSVLPIAQCSRRIVPALRNAGYEVRYIEFPDGHTIPSSIAHDAFAWLSGS